MGRGAHFGICLQLVSVETFSRVEKRNGDSDSNYGVGIQRQ